MRCPHLERAFEHLGEHDYDQQRVSESTPAYNCIAWAAGDDQKRWWPIDLADWWWPPELPKEETLENFVRAFELLGYRQCDHGRPDPGLEKVAIFVDNQGTPTHAARQIDSGAWTSKCGSLEDIEHKPLFNLEGRAYGRAVVVLARTRRR